MNHFDQLLQTARAQAQPPQLLFLFAAAQLPDGASPEERARFEAGQGGTLEPLACVDKTPAELSSFEALLAQAQAVCPGWQVVFIASLSGHTQPPSAAQIDAALDKMVQDLRTGAVAPYMALNPMGEPLVFA